MSCDYSKLIGRIREKFKTQESFALAMNMARSTLNLKLTGKRDFTSTEIRTAAKLLGINEADIPIYFFSLKV